MGKGGKKPEMHEIAETRQAGKDAAFEDILERVKAAGGEITLDETAPLYTEVGSQELEVGYQRLVEFNLNRIDFQLTRKVENAVLQGSGHQKHLEDLEVARSNITMKKKADTSQDWQVVDLEDMF
ncbi:MAG: hypothetical protein O3B47_00125 [bacterium]|nr:hypothetical protein [bacterium]